MNSTPNLDLIPPTALVEPSRNLNLHEGGIRKRGGSAHVNASAITSTPQVMGIFDYQSANGQFLMVATNDGKLYKNFTTTVKTGLGTDKITRMLNFGGTIYVFNGNDIPQTWDGAAAGTSDISAPPADWTGSSYPSWAVVHSNGNARRIWAGGCSGTPNTAYASAIGDGGDYTTTPLSWYLETGSNDGIVGGFEQGSRLFLMSKKNCFYIDDMSLNTSDWGYIKTIWVGGAAHHGVIVVTPNDVHIMAEDGEIYSFTAVQSYGDYKAASLLRPSFMDKWIKDYIDLSKISQFHGVYDPVLRCVKWFMVKSGTSQVNICLPFFVDRPADKAWGAPHENVDYASGYNASASAAVKKSTGNYKIYTGDYSGFVWELETSTKADNANPIEARAKFPRLNFDDPRTSKHYNQMTIVSDIQGEFSASVSCTIDESQEVTGSIDFTSSGAIYGSSLFGTGVYAGESVVDTKFRLGVVGKRIQPEISNYVVNDDFFISNLLFDHKPMGKSNK